MPSSDGSMFDLIGIPAVLALVLANGFFVAAEFSLVAVRRSRVAELVSARRTNAAALQRAVDNLDAYLAATQLGITISSLALGWIGEPALAHLIEPLLSGLPESGARGSLSCLRRPRRPLTKRKRFHLHNSFAQYEHAHRFRLIGKFFWLKGRRRGSGRVFDSVDVEEGCDNRSLQGKVHILRKIPACQSHFECVPVTIPTTLPL